MVLEDLHWADPSTLELARMIVEQCATIPLLVIITARPDFTPTWPLRTHHLQLTLNRLSDHDIREIIEGVAARGVLKSEVVDAVVRRSTGVPLFVEELTRLVLDDDAASALKEIPATLSGSLMARLDRLGEAKAVAETAAVIGRDFDYPMLRALSELADDKLGQCLRSLADADLIHVRGTPPEAVYRFKHQLVRDAAYEVLLKSRRRELHAAIASVIQTKFPSRATMHPELVAHHYAEAGDSAQACKLWQHAGERAASRGAFREAEEHFRHAIAALTQLPEGDDRAAHEMQLQLASGQVMAASRGYSAPETTAAYARARSLSNTSGRGLPIRLLMGLWGIALMRGDLEGARELADGPIGNGSAGGRKVVQSWAYYARGQTYLFRGELAEAEYHLMRSTELCSHGEAGTFPQNPRIESLAVAGCAAWLLGRVDTALERVSLAWREAQGLKLWFDAAFVGAWSCAVQCWRGEFPSALETAEQMLSISTEHHFPQFVALGKIYKGSALCAIGRTDVGLPIVREGLAGNLALGRRLALPELMTWLAEAQISAGLLNDAASTLDDALDAAPGELYWRPETLRLRGEATLCLAQSGSEDSRGDQQREAEHTFLDAINVARQIGARSLELRAATSLARLLLARDEAGRAQELLDPLLSGFAEGQHTRDLIQARQLLLTLNRTRSQTTRHEGPS